MELALWKLILDLPRRRVHLLPTLQTHIPERAYHITSDSIRLDSTSPQTARQRATARLSERVKEKCAGRDSNPELQPYQTDILAIGPPHAYCNNSSSNNYVHAMRTCNTPQSPFPTQPSSYLYAPVCTQWRLSHSFTEPKFIRFMICLSVGSSAPDK